MTPGERMCVTEREAHERLAVLNARQRSSRELMAGFERDAAKCANVCPKLSGQVSTWASKWISPSGPARRASARSSGSVML